MTAFLFTYLEYIVAGLGVVGTVIFIKTKKISNNSNDLTPLIVKHNKQKAAITERTKGVL
jgi:hypothetical protein